MAMDPTVVAALIQGGTALLGGSLGPGSDARSASKVMAAKIRTGKQFGLHPLASIGAQTSGYSGSYIGDGVAAAGKAAADAIKSKSDQPLLDKQGELLDAQIEESRSRTRLNQAEALSRQGPDPFAPRKENALVQVMLENGDIVYIPNPDIYEISPTELATGRGIIEGARVLQKNSGTGGIPNFPANPPLGTIYPDPDPRYEWQFTRAGWRQRKRRK